jgi:hypothetical protein
MLGKFRAVLRDDDLENWKSFCFAMEFEAETANRQRLQHGGLLHMGRGGGHGRRDVQFFDVKPSRGAGNFVRLDAKRLPNQHF